MTHFIRIVKYTVYCLQSNKLKSYSIIVLYVYNTYSSIIYMKLSIGDYIIS